MPNPPAIVSPLEHSPAHLGDRAFFAATVTLRRSAHDHDFDELRVTTAAEVAR